ncbi:MAG: nucleoside kinase, partial [Anaerolineae bacterium]|nr:nucleoside kinase [Anaerolineae bacterium]
MQNNEIRFVEASDQVEIHLPDGRSLCGPRGAAVGNFLAPLEKEEMPPIVGAIINGTLRELTYGIDIESNVEPVTMGTEDGMRIYRRSLTFLLEAAFYELFPEAEIAIDHS